MSDMDTTAELTGEILMELHRAKVTSSTEAAELRGTYASQVKSKVETHGLNKRAFKMASDIRKMENGKRERFWRDVQHYAELMQVNQQKDIFDTIADNNAGKVRTDLDRELDGEAREAGADGDGQVVQPTEARVNAPLKPDQPMGKHTLTNFANIIRNLSDREQINSGLERFCEDHPKLAEEAATIVKDHLRHLGEEGGDGEDLRSSAARQAEADEADQAAQAGKRKGAGKRKARKDAGAEGHPVH